MAQLEKIKTRYEAWLLTGRKIAATTNNANWDLGDWLVTGEQEFDFCKTMAWRGIYDDSEKTPDFWQDVANEIHIKKQTCKNICVVCRAYPKKDRIPELSFTHHAEVASFDRRLEYLRACLVPGERPKTVEWLKKYIRVQEGGAEEPETAEHFVRFPISATLLENLKIIVRYHGGNLQKELTRVCSDALAEYAKTEAKKIPEEQFMPKPLSPEKKARRTGRRPHDSARMREASRIGWDSRRARVAA